MHGATIKIYNHNQCGFFSYEIIWYMNLFSTISPTFFLNFKRPLRILHGFNNKKAPKLRLLNVKLHNLTVAFLTYAVSEHLQHQQTFLSPVALDKKII
jgi:hypothetical protein